MQVKELLFYTSVPDLAGTSAEVETFGVRKNGGDQNVGGSLLTNG
jgi:hypothetical protein